MYKFMTDHHDDVLWADSSDDMLCANRSSTTETNQTQFDFAKQLCNQSVGLRTFLNTASIHKNTKSQSIQLRIFTRPKVYRG